MHNLIIYLIINILTGRIDLIIVVIVNVWLFLVCTKIYALGIIMEINRVLNRWFWPALGAASVIGFIVYLIGLKQVAMSLVILQSFSLLLRFLAMLYFRSKFTVDLLMFIAGFALAFNGMPAEGFILYFLYSIAEMMEFYIERLARRRLEILASLIPLRVLVQRGSTTVEVDVSEVKPGDVVLVRRGESVPANGILLDRGTFDTSALTGEPIPVELEEGSMVESGYINTSPSPVRVKATRKPEESTIQVILKTALEYAEAKGRLARLLEKATPPYTFLVVIAGILGYITLGVNALVSILVAGCPSAFIVSNAASTMLSAAQLARSGIVVKGGLPLERGSRASHVVLDKTGTLTIARPKLAKVVPPRGLDASRVLEVAASAASVSIHPLSKAIIVEAKARGINPPLPREVEDIPGKGLRVEIDGYQVAIGSRSFIEESTGTSIEPPCPEMATVYLSVNGEPGALCFADQLDPSSKKTLKLLKAMGIKVVLASGDQPHRVEAVAKELGIDEYYASMKPGEKLSLINKLRDRSKRPVIMVGDGINDVEALAAADVGVAVGSIEQVINVADVVLKEGIKGLPVFVSLSRAFLNGILAGFALAMIIKVIVALAGSAGAIPLWLVVLLGDDGSTVTASLASGAIILSNWRSTLARVTQK